MTDSSPEDRKADVEPNWREHRREQLRRWAALPLREQIAAVEELGEVARRIQGAPVVCTEACETGQVAQADMLSP